MALNPQLIERNSVPVPLHAPDPQNRLNLNLILTRPTSRLLPLIRVQTFLYIPHPGDLTVPAFFDRFCMLYTRAGGGLHSIRMLYKPVITEHTYAVYSGD